MRLEHYQSNSTLRPQCTHFRLYCVSTEALLYFKAHSSFLIGNSPDLISRKSTTTRDKMTGIFHVLSVTAVLLVIAEVRSAPDVNQLPTRSFNPGHGGSVAGCAKLAGQENQCVEKIAKMEYRPLITVIEQRYKVPVPDITYTDVIDPEEEPTTVNMPRPFTTKVPVKKVKEVVETVKLRKIKETAEKVPVTSTDVIRIPKKIPEPRVTEETISVPEIKKNKVRKEIKRYRTSNPKRVPIDTYKEVRTVKRLRRPILEIRPRYVNRTRIEYIDRVVEVPQVIVKTIRLPRPVIRPGETVYEEKSDVQVKNSDYEEDVAEFVDQTVDVDEVRREPKTIRIPYKEVTRVVRPVVFEAPISMPQEQPVDVERHTRVPGPEVTVPCGVQTPGARYLPAPCPPCSGSGACPSCRSCNMHFLK